MLAREGLSTWISTAEMGPARHRSVTATCNTKETRAHPCPPHLEAPAPCPRPPLYAITGRAQCKRVPGPGLPAQRQPHLAKQPADQLQTCPLIQGEPDPRRPPQTKATTARTDNPGQERKRKGWVVEVRGQPTALGGLDWTELNMSLARTG